MGSFDFKSLMGNVGAYVPRIAGAIVIFIIGWIVAAICRMLVRKGLGALRLNDRIIGKSESGLNLEKIVASVVFWVILLFALIAAFNVLNLPAVSGPLESLAAAVMLYLPRILLAGILCLIAWLVGTILRKVVTAGLGATSLDRKLPPPEDSTAKPLSQTLGDVIFWLVILLFLPAIVGALAMHGLLAPLKTMVHDILNYVPNIIAALFVGGIGYLIARVFRNVVTSLLAATQVDRLTRGKDGKEGIKISQLCGTLVFLFVFVPALIAALQALRIAVVAQPAQHMLHLVLNAVPNILAAGIILAIAWFIGKFIADMLSQLLRQMGFDRLPAHLGFKGPAEDASAGEGASHASPSDIVGRIALVFVIAFAVMEAAHRLGFAGIDSLFEQLIRFAAQVFFGLIILAVGQWLANLAAKAIRYASADHSVLLARIARIAIMGLVIAMGLHAMHFGQSIVDLAFGLTLGAVAVAVAIAFGVGGRHAAGRITQHWVDGYLGRDERSSSSDE